MEEDKLLISLMQVFIAQMDSALKISNIISEHSNEKEMSADSIIIGLIYRLMISMDEEEMNASMNIAKEILYDSSSNEEYSSDEDTIDMKELLPRKIKINTCNCNICARARACLLDYPNYEALDPLAQKFKNAIDKTCNIHKINII